ncbi:YdiY family protein [Thalassotalea euphylliae]|uniref:DUF481 domain-containing protein n=1 Tax=Thalassotalea euphylliae TaxID=1655234 RepID=UPI0036440E14
MPRLTSSLLVLSLGCATLPFYSGAVFAETNEKWKPPRPKISQDFDWIQTTSGEWLKGDIIAMYDEELEFDSDEFGIQTIDIEDIAELRSKGVQSIRMDDGTIVEGQVVILDGKLKVIDTDRTYELPLKELLSIASAEDNELDLWDGEVNFGANFRKGNTETLDYTFSAEAQRRTSTSRLKADFVANFSESEDKDTGETTETANSRRLTAFYDWFFSQRIFFRAADFEYFADELGNIDYRATLGVGLGYHVVETDDIQWDVTAGPSYQQTRYIEVEPGEDDTENSSVLMLGTYFEWELTKDIDFETKYQVQIVSEEAGELIHHLQTGVEIELINDFDLDLTLYVDRVDKPRPEEDGRVPDKDDYRFVVSLGYEF